MKKLIIGVLAILGVLVIMFKLGGSIGVTGLFYFNGRYYSDPNYAFWNDYHPVASNIDSTKEVKELNDIGVVRIDEYNAIYLASDENDDLFICGMKCKKDKYFFAGDIKRCYKESLDDYQMENSIENEALFHRFNKYGIVDGDYTFEVVKLEDNVSYDENAYEIHKFTDVDNFPPFIVLIELENDK